MRVPGMLAYGAELLVAVTCLAVWLVATALAWPWWAQLTPFLLGLGAGVALIFGSAATNPRHDTPGYRGLT